MVTQTTLTQICPIENTSYIITGPNPILLLNLKLYIGEEYQFKFVRVFVCVSVLSVRWLISVVSAPIKLKLDGEIEYTHIFILQKKKKKNHNENNTSKKIYLNYASKQGK